MATRQYIGARYVPKFYENSDGTAEWRSGVIYEPLTIVTWNGNSYTSKKVVPATIGDPSSNSEYWVATGIYNEQLAHIGEQVEELSELTKMVDWVTPEMYGAAADGATDDSAAIQSAINEGMERKVPIVCVGEYYIGTGLRITKDFTTFICTGFIYSDSDITILTVSSNRNYIKINRFYNRAAGWHGTGLCIYKGANDNLGIVTSFNRCEINNIEGFAIGILCKAEASYGIQYNVFDFEYIWADVGVQYEVGDRAWVTQEAFYNGRLSGRIGVNVVENSDMLHSDNNVFSNIGFENVTETALKLFRVKYSFFNDIRVAENAEASYIFDLKECETNYFTGHIILPIAKLRDVDTCPEAASLNVRYNDFVCTYVERASGGWAGKHLLSANGTHFIDDPTSMYYHITKIEQSYDFREEEYVSSGLEFWGGASGSSGNIVYTLPWFFKVPGRYFVFKCSYKTGGSTITIQFPDGTVILPDSKIESGKSYLVYPLANGFHAEEITL